MTSQLDRLPRHVRARIERIAIDDREAFVSRPVPALGNVTIEAALAAEDGLRRVMEYLTKVEAIVGPEPPPHVR